MKHMILDPEWTMNGSFNNELAKEKKPIYNPIKALVKNLALEHIVASYDMNEYNAADNLLFLAGAALDRIDARSPQRKAAVEQASRFFNTQVELIIDRLAETEPGAVGSELGPLLKNKLRGFGCRIGSINITREDEPPIDILYLADPDEYEAVFKAIGVSDQTPVEPLGNNTVRAFMDGEKQLLFPDSVLIADYQVARWNSEQDNFDGMVRSLFGYRASTLPLLMIRGISSGEPRILVYPTLYGKHGPKPSNYRELLDAMSSPAVRLNHDQLFDADAESLDKVAA
jgi:hypothetical protein